MVLSQDTAAYEEEVGVSNTTIRRDLNGLKE